MGESPQRSILDEIFIKYHFPYFCLLLPILTERQEARKRQLQKDSGERPADQTAGIHKNAP
jgi:hypothetical protein